MGRTWRAIVAGAILATAEVGNFPLARGAQAAGEPILPDADPAVSVPATDLALATFAEGCDASCGTTCGDTIRSTCGAGVGGLDPWNLSFSQTVDYGTNLALPISLTPLNTPVGPLSDPTIGGITRDIGLLDPLDPPVARFRDDFQFQTEAGAVRNWSLSDDSSFSAGVNYYQSLHPRVEELDLMAPSALANYSVRTSDATIVGVDYEYIYYFLDTESFVSQSTVTPTLQTRWSDRVDLKATISYGNANFRGTDFIDSDNYATTGEMYYYTDGARQNYLLLGGGYGYSNAFDDSFSYHVPSVYCGAAWWFGERRRNQFEIIASYYDYNFQGIDPVDLVSREDHIYSVAPILSRTIDDNLRLFAAYTYYSSDSNVSRQDYDQSLISLGAQLAW
jgi:hypothetical protein